MDEELNYLVVEGIKWVQSQRDSLRPTGAELAPKLKNLYSKYFSNSVLDVARLSIIEVIPNPPFFANLPQIPFDFQVMDGITYDDTILITESSARGSDVAPLVFHELVHVVQYRVLGVEEFIRQYVQGWAENGRDYFAIPLEVEAYSLQERFEKGEDFIVEEIANKE